MPIIVKVVVAGELDNNNIMSMMTKPIIVADKTFITATIGRKDNTYACYLCLVDPKFTEFLIKEIELLIKADVFGTIFKHNFKINRNQNTGKIVSLDSGLFPEMQDENCISLDASTTKISVMYAEHKNSTTDYELYDFVAITVGMLFVNKIFVYDNDGEESIIILSILSNVNETIEKICALTQFAGKLREIRIVGTGRVMELFRLTQT